MKIIIDGMGGDNAPVSTVKGAIDAVNEYNIDLVIVGREEEIKKELKKYDYNHEKIQILNAEEVIENTEDPALAIRRKKDSSMVVGLNALKNGLGDGFISAGSTGALLAGGLFIIKRIEKINRAALTSVYPTSKGISLLVDAGANIDCKPEYLNQFAIMGSIYMETAMGIKNPKVALANIGDEEGKGNQLAKDTYSLLRESNINFIGNIEGRDIPNGNADIIVADGFVGNIILKLTEGVALSLLGEIRKIVYSDTRSKLGGILLKPGLSKLKKKLDYREYGGAPLLGIKLPVVKAHGSSDDFAIKNGIRQLIAYIEADAIKVIEKELSDKVNI